MLVAQLDLDAFTLPEGKSLLCFPISTYVGCHSQMCVHINNVFALATVDFTGNNFPGLRYFLLFHRLFTL
jgi:hypothetical protein